MLDRFRVIWVLLLAVTAIGSAGAQEVGYTVKPGDTLLISVWKEPDLQGEVLVTPDGAFAFPLVGQVDARGKTVTDLQKIVSDKLKQYIADPVVTVSVKDIKGNKVYVIGQVTRPGEFIVNPRVDVMQALSMAGGTTAFACSATSSSCGALARSRKPSASITRISSRVATSRRTSNCARVTSWWCHEEVLGFWSAGRAQLRPGNGGGLELRSSRGCLRRIQRQRAFI